MEVKIFCRIFQLQETDRGAKLPFEQFCCSQNSCKVATRRL